LGAGRAVIADIVVTDVFIGGVVITGIVIPDISVADIVVPDVDITGAVDAEYVADTVVTDCNDYCCQAV
jgi:hypothetical protein